MERRIVLASASPRRVALLAEAGLRFEQRPVDVDETLEAFDGPERAALELAARKGRRALAELADGPPRGGCLVLSADTVVAVPSAAGGGWRLLGKPADEGEAHGMLRRLSGTRHAVTTGVFAARFDGGADPEGAVTRTAAETTWVTMRAITQEEVEAYARSGEWRDKAGGYAIQETADAFVTDLSGGGFDNVVGLPVALALRLLGELEGDPAR